MLRIVKSNLSDNKTTWHCPDIISNQYMIPYLHDQRLLTKWTNSWTHSTYKENMHFSSTCGNKTLRNDDFDYQRHKCKCNKCLSHKLAKERID